MEQMTTIPGAKTFPSEPRALEIHDAVIFNKKSSIIASKEGGNPREIALKQGIYVNFL